jgi:CRP/FNR family cyclic AMP-dependent transcriptional regulator
MSVGHLTSVRLTDVGTIALVISKATQRDWLGTQQVAAQLANVPLFSSCSSKELGIIARAAKEVSHPAGTELAREGESGIGLFLIIEGTAQISIGGRTRGSLRPGDFFGEVALLDRGPRSASVTATSDVRLLGITQWVFRGLLHEYPSIAVKTLQVLAGRVRSAAMSPTL